MPSQIIDFSPQRAPAGTTPGDYVKQQIDDCIAALNDPAAQDDNDGALQAATQHIHGQNLTEEEQTKYTGVMKKIVEGTPCTTAQMLVMQHQARLTKLQEVMGQIDVSDGAGGTTPTYGLEKRVADAKAQLDAANECLATASTAFSKAPSLIQKAREYQQLAQQRYDQWHNLQQHYLHDLQDYQQMMYALEEALKSETVLTKRLNGAIGLVDKSLSIPDDAEQSNLLVVKREGAGKFADSKILDGLTCGLLHDRISSCAGVFAEYKEKGPDGKACGFTFNATHADAVKPLAIASMNYYARRSDIPRDTPRQFTLIVKGGDYNTNAALDLSARFADEQMGAMVKHQLAQKALQIENNKSPQDAAAIKAKEDEVAKWKGRAESSLQTIGPEGEEITPTSDYFVSHLFGRVHGSEARSSFAEYKILQAMFNEIDKQLQAQSPPSNLTRPVRNGNESSDSYLQRVFAENPNDLADTSALRKALVSCAVENESGVCASHIERMRKNLQSERGGSDPDLTAIQAASNTSSATFTATRPSA